MSRLADAVDQVHRAFGAPGDWGYGTDRGRALYELYKAADQAAELPESPLAAGALEQIKQARAAFNVTYAEDGRILALFMGNDALRKVVLLLDAAIRTAEGRL